MSNPNTYNDSENRCRTDEILLYAEHAWQRFKAPDASFGVGGNNTNEIENIVSKEEETMRTNLPKQ